MSKCKNIDSNIKKKEIHKINYAQLQQGLGY